MINAGTLMVCSQATAVKDPAGGECCRAVRDGPLVGAENGGFAIAVILSELALAGAVHSYLASIHRPRNRTASRVPAYREIEARIECETQYIEH